VKIKPENLFILLFIHTRTHTHTHTQGKGKGVKIKPENLLPLRGGQASGSGGDRYASPLRQRT